MEPTGALVAAAAAVGAAGALSSFASAASQGMNTKGALPTTPPPNTPESIDLWAKVQAAIQKRRLATTEQQRVEAGNELDAASKAYDAYLKKTPAVSTTLQNTTDTEAEAKAKEEEAKAKADAEAAAAAAEAKAKEEAAAAAAAAAAALPALPAPAPLPTAAAAAAAAAAAVETRDRLLSENPGTITESEFASLKSPDDDEFIGQYTQREIVPEPGEFRDMGLPIPRMWVRNSPPAAEAPAPAAESAAPAAESAVPAPAPAPVPAPVPAPAAEAPAPALVRPYPSPLAQQLPGEPEYVSSRRGSVVTSDRMTAEKSEGELRGQVGDDAVNALLAPAPSRSEPAASVNSGSSLASVGMSQTKDLDFAVRLGKAKEKFEQMQAARMKLQTKVDASKLVRKPTKRARITQVDIDNLYKELEASQSKRQAKTVLERNERAQRGRTAKVAPAPDTADNELAAIEADLKSAEETVEQFKALVDELRAKDSGVPEVAEWIMSADLELELQLDYLSQVERNLADVPPPKDLTRLREVHRNLGLPRPPASPPQPASRQQPASRPRWKGGSRTPRRRKLRNSTFRRHRKH